MGDDLIGNLNSRWEDSKHPEHTAYCAICNTRLPLNAIFCPECDPPLPPGGEPEETGISFEQALQRIGLLVILFLGLAFAKLEISFDYILSEKQVINEQEKVFKNKQPHDRDLQIVNIIRVPLANIRSKPSMDGNIIMVAEQGMSLEIIEGNEHWSKVRVLENTGWISNKLFNSEILTPE